MRISFADKEPILAGKTALVTGASRGIGAAIAEGLAANGAKVVLAARSVDELNQLADRFRREGAEARVIATDVTNPDSMKAAVDFAVAEFGRLDIAVNNAGLSQRRVPLQDLAPAAFDTTMQINVYSLLIAMQHEIKAMLATGGGSIINIGSVTSVIAVPQMAAYVASRHAVVGMTKSAALDYAQQNIRINVVAPGPVMTAQLKGGGAATPEGEERMRSAIPMGRIGQPHEVVGAVVLLASDAASFMTGVYLPVDGGYIVP